MYYKLVYNCIYNLLHVRLKWMICAQIIFRIKWNPKLFYIFHSKYCYVPERQHMFPFYSKLAYIMFQEDRHKHLKCLGREENILLFFAPLIVAIHPSKLSTLCFSEARKQNLSIPALRLFLEYPTFWMPHGYEFVIVCTSTSTDLTLYFPGTLLGCRAFV